MAKVYQDGIIPISMLADADVSAKQYYCVRTASTDGYAKVANGASNSAPIGILQDDVGDEVGDAVSIKTFGFSLGVVSACDIAGNACVIKFGTYLRTGSNGQLYATGGGDAIATARAFDSMSTGCGILNVFFFGGAAGCAVAAS